MRTELFTVSKIFTESLYRIPDYQRGYSWGLDQLRDFWLDLQQLHSNGNHYTGVLTLEEVPDEKWKNWEDDSWIIESRRYKPFYIVDGQQRLTTVIILLQSILESSNNSALNFTPITDIRRKYIFDSKVEDSARSYIFGYEKDNPSYEYLKKRIFLEDSDVHLPDEVTIYTKNLIAAKEFFLNELSTLSQPSLEDLYTKVTQQLVFNVYEISADIDVFVTFETMNNRGKPLSILELLKNRLIFLSTKLNSSTGREGVLRRKINDAWKSAYHYLGKNDDRPLKDDKFLETHLSYYYLTTLYNSAATEQDEIENEYRRYHANTDNISRFLLNELFSHKRLISIAVNPKNSLPIITKEFIDNFSQNLKNSVELYYKLSTPSDSEYSADEKMLLERIYRLSGSSPIPLLLAIYKKEKRAEKRIKALIQLERVLFCNSWGSRQVFNRRQPQGNGAYFNYVIGKMSIDELISYLENNVTEFFKDVSMNELLNDWVRNGHGYYGWKAIKYFLFEYEIMLQERSKTDRQKISWEEFEKESYDDYKTVEHIYPQRAKHQYWTDRFGAFTPGQKRLLRNSLGNLLALSHPKNSSLGNKSFEDKKGDDKTQTGYKYGSYSEIEVSNFENWGPQEILNRGIALLNFMESRWSLPIGEKSQKIKALGLEFLTKIS